MGCKFHNSTPPTVLIQSEPNFMISKAAIGEYKLINVLTICQKLQILCHLEILRWKSMGKSYNVQYLENG